MFTKYDRLVLALYEVWQFDVENILKMNGENIPVAITDPLLFSLYSVPSPTPLEDLTAFFCSSIRLLSITSVINVRSNSLKGSLTTVANFFL